MKKGTANSGLQTHKHLPTLELALPPKHGSREHFRKFAFALELRRGVEHRHDLALGLHQVFASYLVEGAACVEWGSVSGWWYWWKEQRKAVKQIVM